MRLPTYSKAMRQQAKATKTFMVTVDIIRPDGTRDVCFQYAMTKHLAKRIVDAMLRAVKPLHDEGTPDAK